MIKCEKQNLQSLSKEQLIKIIEDYRHTEFLIGETLVDESKWHIDSEKAIEKIREYLCNAPQYPFYHEYLKDFIDLQLGKISGEEYRKIVLGED